jgi:hypothetical protein
LSLTQILGKRGRFEISSHCFDRQACVIPPSNVPDIKGLNKHMLNMKSTQILIFDSYNVKSYPTISNSGVLIHEIIRQSLSS